MSYKVRYGTAVEPWHTLSLFYSPDTVRMYPGLGQAGPSFETLMYGVLGATFAAGMITMHLMHRSRVLGMNRRRRRRR
jgi:hypothetical protein